MKLEQTGREGSAAGLRRAACSEQGQLRAGWTYFAGMVQYLVVRYCFISLFL